MKIAVMSFSGNVGKSTVARHVVLPKVRGGDFVTIESINADEGVGENFKGKDFGQLIEQMMLIDHAVVDVGASNVEEVLRRMELYEGSHEDFDAFVIPVTRESKQISDTINTIDALAQLGVPPERIRLVFNRMTADDEIPKVFAALWDFHADKKQFTLLPGAAVMDSEIFPLLRDRGLSLDEFMADETDWKAALRDAASPAEKLNAAKMIGMRRLGASAKRNVDAVSAAVFEGIAQ